MRIRNVELSRDRLNARIRYQEHLPIADFWSRNVETYPITRLADAQARFEQLKVREYTRPS
jgi:hypothetical protein